MSEASSDNRDKLLSCALELFARRGYEATSVQEIVEAAGLTKPTLYHYYGSKAALFGELIATYTKPQLMALEQATRYHGDLPLNVRKVITSCFDYADKEASFYRLLLATWFTPPESAFVRPVLEAHRRQHQLLERLFLEAARDHGNLKGRQRNYAISLMGLVNTYVAAKLNGHLALDEALIQQVTHQFMHGIFS